MGKRFMGLIMAWLVGTAAALAQPELAAPADPPRLVPVPEGAAPRPPAKPSATYTAYVEPLVEDEPHATACFPCPTADCGERFWAEASYLLWWIKDGPLHIPLATTGPASSAGAIGESGTAALFGLGDLDYDSFPGGRFASGWWLNPERTYALEGSGFFLFEESIDYVRGSNAAGLPLLARPIRNAQTDDETSILAAAPDRFAGGVNISAHSRFWGVEGNLLANLIRQGRTGLDLIAGFRYLDLEEDIEMMNRTAILAGGLSGYAGIPVLAPNSLFLRDSFATRNRFYGGQLGLRARIERGRWLVDATGKVAVGGIYQRSRVGGSTSLIQPDTGIVGTLPGGVLAQPTNIGKQSRTEESVVPEATIRFYYQITKRITAHAGFTFLYMDKVVRPGDQITRQVNLTQVPTSLSFGTLTGPREPAPRLQDVDFWAQGFDFGLSFRF